VRVLTGSLIQESNTFSPIQSDLTLFRAGCLRYDDDSLASMAGTHTEMGGFLAASRRHGMELVPTLAAWAPSGGPIVATDFDRLAGAFLQRVRAAGPVDGVLLALHGAWVSEQHEDADGWLLAEVRQRVGPDVPVVVTLDFHANVTPLMMEHADALVGFRSYPHIDMFETGERATALLARLLHGGVRPAMVSCKIPMIVPPENAQTTDGPVAEVMRMVIEAEGNPNILSASLFVVQPWLNIADLGCTVTLVTLGTVQRAQQMADAAGERLWDRRHRLTVPLVPPAEAVAQALRAPRWPVLLVDSADSVSSGAPGDSTALLRALVDAPLQGPALLTLVDPGAARLAVEADGTTLTLRLGGRRDPARHQPVTLTGLVRRVRNPLVTFTAGVGDGLTADMGVAAVIETGAIRLLVMEKPVPCYDPALYRVAGLEPSDAQIVAVKSPTNFRWTYRDIAQDWIYVDAPGASTPRLRSLPYTRITHPFFPFDDWPWRAGT
jgi:microcystin degradation protein MlrC